MIESQLKESEMPTYEPNITAVLCIDFYNDFMSEGGKLFPLIKDIAEEVGAFENFRKIVDAARAAGITIFHVPHHRMEPGCFHDWKYPAPYQLLAGADRWRKSGRCEDRAWWQAA